MRRMPFNIEVMEKLAKELAFNKDTNTMEFGGNVYIDGKLNGHVLTEYDGAKVEVYYLADDMVIFEVIDTNANDYYGVGYIANDQSDIYGMAYSDINDTLGYFECTLTEGQIQLSYQQYVAETNLPKYYLHELKFMTGSDVYIYLSYPSKNNLVIDSLQDLTTVVKPNTNTRLGFGTGYLYYEGNVWKSSTTNAAITAVEDNVVIID